jgi:hypothetical protein
LLADSERLSCIDAYLCLLADSERLSCIDAYLCLLADSERLSCIDAYLCLLADSERLSCLLVSELQPLLRRLVQNLFCELIHIASCKMTENLFCMLLEKLILFASKTGETVKRRLTGQDSHPDLWRVERM